MSTLGNVQYIEEYHNSCGEGIIDKSLKIPDVLNIPWCTRDIP